MFILPHTLLQVGRLNTIIIILFYVNRRPNASTNDLILTLLRSRLRFTPANFFTLSIHLTPCRPRLRLRSLGTHCVALSVHRLSVLYALRDLPESTFFFSRQSTLISIWLYCFFHCHISFNPTDIHQGNKNNNCWGLTSRNHDMIMRDTVVEGS